LAARQMAGMTGSFRPQGGAELPEERITITDGDGNDVVPELTRKHEASAKAACQRIEFLNNLPRREVGPQADRV
jgi:hypothetical protein